MGQTLQGSKDPFGEQFVTLALGDEFDDTVCACCACQVQGCQRHACAHLAGFCTVRRHAAHSRHGGKQFGTAPTRKSRDVSRAVPEFMPDPYETSGERMRRLRKEALAATKRRLKVPDQRPAFRPSSAKWQREEEDVFVSTEVDKSVEPKSAWRALGCRSAAPTHPARSPPHHRAARVGPPEQGT